MDVNQAIDKLKEIQLLTGKVECKTLSGGTSSGVTLITDQSNIPYIIKTNDQNVIKAEATFLREYENIDFFPHVVYVDPDFHYFVYSFIEGDMNSTSVDKRTILLTIIKNIVNRYKSYEESKEWGWIFFEVSSWHTFLQNEIYSAEEIIQGEIFGATDIEFVRTIMNDLQTINHTRKPYYLHGDCGFHNFLITQHKLAAVIDPVPLIGDPIHDVVYAYCSTPNQLTKDLIDELAANVTTWDLDHQILYDYVIIGLFVRLSRCYLHHPHDMKEYLQAWDYWKAIVQDS